VSKQTDKEFLVDLAERLTSMACEAYNEGEDDKSRELLADARRLRKISAVKHE
jgi:hypothetical protein